jgi:preprotein translocase subunit SecA
VEGTVSQWTGDKTFAEEWDLDGLLAGVAEVYPTRLTRKDLEEGAATVAELSQMVLTDALALYEEKEQLVGSQVMRELEPMVLMSLTDNKWREHLYEMDYLQEGIHLRAYAQRDPLTEYRREAFDMFEALTRSIREDLVKYIYRVELVRQDQPPQTPRQRVQRVQENRSEVAAGAGGAGESTAPSGGGDHGGEAATDVKGATGVKLATNPNQVFSDKVPRNAPCPCGSGRKYKKCHGATVTGAVTDAGP